MNISFFPLHTHTVSRLKRDDGKSVHLDTSVHQYICPEHPEILLKSVTLFIQLFFKEFNKELIAQRLAQFHPEYTNFSAEQITGRWRSETDRGSLIHNEIEQFLLLGTTPQQPKGKYAAEWLKQFDSPRYILYPEQRLFSLTAGIAGTADLLIEDKNTGSFTVIDWKSNKLISRTGYKGRYGTHPATASLPDCNFTKYSLQLNFYKFLAESSYGISVSEMKIVHLKDSGITVYTVEPLRTTICEMIANPPITIKNE